jgi:transposase
MRSRSTPLAANGSHLELSAEERVAIERMIHDGPPSLARRARIIAARADGLGLSAIAKSVGLHRDSVRRWLLRYGTRGIAGLQHGNTGRPKNVVFDATARREIARRASLSPSTVGESFAAWSLYKLRAHLLAHRIVPHISVERLRQVLAEEHSPRAHWQRSNRVGPLSPEVRHQLVELLQQPQLTPAQRAARAVLAVADGASISAVAHSFHLGRHSVRRWLDDFRNAGIAGLLRGGAPARTATQVPAAEATAPEADAPFATDTQTPNTDRLIRSQ